MMSKELIQEMHQHISEIEGVKELFNWLFLQDYFTAPASRSSHHAEEGGLCAHSLEVAENLLKLSSMYGFEWQRKESPYLIGYFHDLCKVNYYSESSRNVKDENGEWTTAPYYTINPKLPLGHGHASALILQRFVRLTEQETMCIAYHMGAFGDANYQRDFSRACDLFPEILLVTQADHLSAIGDKNKPLPFKAFNDEETK